MELKRQQVNKKAGSFDPVLQLAMKAVFPRFCVGCGEEGELLCDKCSGNWSAGHVPQKCIACKKESIFGKTCETCTREDTPDGHITTYSYADPIVRKLISGWKYSYDDSAWKLLRTQILPELNTLRQCMNTFGIQTVTSIRLHQRKLCMRGFDQAWECAEFVSENLEVQHVDILERARATGKQVDRSDRERRLAMLQSPFKILPGVYVPKKVLLVDDVWTTGSTARAAVKTLRSAGAEIVWVYTIARG